MRIYRCKLHKFLLASLAIGFVLEAFIHVPTSFADTSLFEPPTGVPSPKTTSGAATRGNCDLDPSQEELGMVAILPKTKSGLTVSSHPEFLAYIPKTSAKQIFFTIKNEEDDSYQTTLPLSSKPGIVSIKLPSDAPELVIGKSYLWSIALICGDKLRVDSPFVEGWIQRIPKTQDLAAKLQKANPIEELTLYGERGIWYDMISGVSKLRISSTDRQTSNRLWEKILQANGLSEVVLANSQN